MQAGGRPIGTHRISKQRDCGDRISKQLPDGICICIAGSGNCVVTVTAAAAAAVTAAAAAAAVGSRNVGGDGGGGGALGIAGGSERRGRR